jgi:hypothetical protein
MLMSTGPLVADVVRRMIEALPECHDNHVWMDVTTGEGDRPLMVGCVGAHAAIVGGIVEWIPWDDRTQEGGLTHTATGSQVYADDDRWYEWGRTALDITHALADRLFDGWTIRTVAVEALRDLVDGVPQDVITERLRRTVIKIRVPFTNHGMYLLRPYRRD